MKNIISVCLGIIIMASVAYSADKNCPKKSSVLPDLAITDVKVDSSAVKSTGKVKVIYTIKNRGKLSSKASALSVKALDKDGKQISKSVQKDIPILPPSRSYTTEINYNVAKKGDMVFKAAADYNDKITESDESNNNNTMKFSIGFGL